MLKKPRLSTLNDLWVRISGIALVWLISIWANHLLIFPFTQEKLMRMGISLVSIALTWHLIRYLIFYFRHKYANRHETAKRLLVTFLIGSFTSAILVWITSVLRHLLLYGSLEKLVESASSITINEVKLELTLYGFDFVRASLTFLFFQSIYEGMFFAQSSRKYQSQLKEAEREKERLQTANLQSQLDALKQQVNPHFLFNSLNALDSLIEEDPRQARVFLDELSTVYRYLLRANDSHLTTLHTELEFIHSYYHLLKTRYGDGLSLEIAIDEALMHHRIPPLTLQLLLENAVKHNSVLPDQPLIIRITTNAQQQLLVCNNLQRKAMRVHSSGIGLSNIMVKYQMLGEPMPVVQESDTQFWVTLPLIAAK